MVSVPLIGRANVEVSDGMALSRSRLEDHCFTIQHRMVTHYTLPTAAERVGQVAICVAGSAVEAGRCCTIEVKFSEGEWSTRTQLTVGPLAVIGSPLVHFILAGEGGQMVSVCGDGCPLPCHPFAVALD